MQNRAAQHAYRIRQQGLVSSLQADNHKLRAERERLKKENQELRQTLAQINSVTIGLQYWLDGGFNDKGGCWTGNGVIGVDEIPDLEL